MIEVLQEVTDWKECPTLNKSNGTYWVQKRSGNLLAFKPPGGERKVFDSSKKLFSKSRRKFKLIETIEEME